MLEQTRLCAIVTILLTSLPVLAAPQPVPPDRALLRQRPAPAPGDPAVPLHRHRLHGYLGGQLGGVANLAQSTDYDGGYLGHFGGSLGLFGGVRLNPYLAVEGNWTFSLHDGAWADGQATGVRVDSLYIMTVTADLKAYLPTRSLMEPYLQGGVGFALGGAIQLPGDASDVRQDSLFAKGLVLNAGAGLDLWLSRHVCMGGRVLYRGLAFGAPELEPLAVAASNFVSSITVDAFASIHF